MVWISKLVMVCILICHVEFRESVTITRHLPRIVFVDIFLTTGIIVVCLYVSEVQNAWITWVYVMNNDCMSCRFWGECRTLLNSYERFSFGTSLTFMLQFDIDHFFTVSLYNIFFCVMYTVCKVALFSTQSFTQTPQYLRPLNKFPHMCTRISLRACRVYWFMYRVPAWHSRFNNLDRDW